MSMLWSGPKRTFDVPCTVEIEQTSETLHAHVMLDGDIDIRPGDEVKVHDAPTDIKFGERIVVRRTATVVRGSALDRIWARIEGYLELTELYEITVSSEKS